MSIFKKGDKILLKNGDTATILEEFGSGGQGTVYKVNCAGKTYALKWYHKGAFKDGGKNFYQNLENNIKSGPPNGSFLWPKILTSRFNDSFGYLMDIRPSGYNELVEFFVSTQKNKQVHFKSFDAQINAVLNILDGFDKLHKKGYSYQDINDGNFFISPENGDVLICDNDNVAPYGFNLGILGKQRYMAPEVVVGSHDPDKQSDRFSLSVILFRLLFINHPLEGQYSTPPCMTKDLERKFYGEKPIFIYDPKITINRPVPGTDKNLKRFWESKIYPDFIKSKFEEAFSQKVMKNREERIVEDDWKRIFIRLKASVVRCPYCGELTFVNADNNYHCVNRCNKELKVFNQMRFHNGTTIPLFPGVKIFYTLIEQQNTDFNKIMGEVIQNPKDPTKYGIRNLSDKTWVIHLPDGSSKPLPPNQLVPVKTGFSIDFIGKNAQAGEII